MTFRWVGRGSCSNEVTIFEVEFLGGGGGTYELRYLAQFQQTFNIVLNSVELNFSIIFNLAISAAKKSTTLRPFTAAVNLKMSNHDTNSLKLHRMMFT